jgi:hypothetical protein
MNDPQPGTVGGGLLMWHGMWGKIPLLVERVSSMENYISVV